MRKIVIVLLIICMLIPEVSYAASYGKGKRMTVLSTEGEVTVVRGVEKDLLTYKGMRLEKNDIIETGKSGSISINIDDKQVTLLDKDTTIKISNGWWGKIRIELIQGTVVNKVVKNSGIESETKTPNTTFGVRGTVYSVTVADNETKGITYEGEVSVQVKGRKEAYRMQAGEQYISGQIQALDTQSLNEFEQKIYLEIKEKEKEKDQVQHDIQSQDINFAGGDGTKENPYLISKREHLIKLATSEQLLNKNYKQTQNIIVDEWYVPIGKERAFEGTYDGGGYAIIFSELQASQKGVFEYLGEAAYIYNLNVESSEYKAGERAGGIASNNRGRIENCKVSISHLMTDETTTHIGGIVSINEGIIKKCETKISNLNVGESVSYVGGIAAINKGSIEDTVTISTIIIPSPNRIISATAIATNESDGFQKDCIDMSQIIYK